MQVRKPTRLIAVSVVAALAVSGSAAVASSLITSASIKDGTIQAKDLSKKARKSLRGKKGPQGNAGPAGAKGLPGPVVLKYVVGPTSTVGTAKQQRVEADCPAGMHVVGGGVFSEGGLGVAGVNSSDPLDTTADSNTVPDNGWEAFVDVFNVTSPRAVRAYAICSLADAVG